MHFLFTAKFDEIFSGEIFAENEEDATYKLAEMFTGAPNFQIVDLNPVKEMTREEFVAHREQVIANERKALN